MDIRVIGAGSPNCNRLWVEAKKAVARTGVDANITKVDAVEDIFEYGVLITPALLVDGEVKFSGRVPNAAEIARTLRPIAPSPRRRHA